VVEETIGGKYLTVKFKPCNNSKCPLRGGCCKIGVHITEQKYFGSSFGIKDPKLVVGHASRDSYHGESGMVLASASAPEFRGSILYVGGSDAHNGGARCSTAPIEDTLQKIRTAVVEYNFKKGLEEKWQKKS
jgi:hypothetical protein